MDNQNHNPPNYRLQLDNFAAAVAAAREAESWLLLNILGENLDSLQLNAVLWANINVREAMTNLGNIRLWQVSIYAILVLFFL